MDFYPNLMNPSLEVSMLYYLYHLPFVILFLLVLQPIPMAVVYDSFRMHRINILVSDRIKRRSALLACFITLD